MRRQAFILSPPQRVIMVVVLVLLGFLCLALVHCLRAPLSLSFIGYRTGYKYTTNWDGVIPARGALFLLRNNTKHEYRVNLDHTVVHPFNGSTAMTQQCVLYDFFLKPSQRIEVWAPEPDTAGHWHCAFELAPMPEFGWEMKVYNLATRYPVLMPVYDKFVFPRMRRHISRVTLDSPEIYP